MTKILVICEKITLIAIGSTRRVGHVTCKELDWKSQLTIGRQQSKSLLIEKSRGGRFLWNRI